MTNAAIIEHETYYEIDGCHYPRFHHIAASLGIIDTTWFTDAGRNRGELIAQLTALDDRGELTDDKLNYVRERWTSVAGQEAEALDGYLIAWRAFRMRHYDGFAYALVEQVFINTSLGYATRPDRIYVAAAGQSEVCEIKLGSLQPWYELQVAAQACAWKALDPEQLNRRVVLLSPDGIARVKTYDAANGDRWWQSVISAWNFGLKAGIYKIGD